MAFPSLYSVDEPDGIPIVYFSSTTIIRIRIGFLLALHLDFKLDKGCIFYTNIDEKATSPFLLDIDWDTTLQIVDLIRQGDITPKSATNTLANKLRDSNPNVVLLALQVLESIVKNCGSVVHEYVATTEFMGEMRDVLKRFSNEEVQKRVLLLLAAWVYAFRSEPKLRAVQDAVNILKAEGHHIPTVTESDAMFTADSAPVWADGGCCHRCRAQFTMLRRKHHCRACGQVFCSDCSSKSSTIPKFGIEREVRVCEYCYDEINNPQLANSKPKMDHTVANGPNTQKNSSNSKSAEELQEEEELQLALALSKSEAENKEKEKLKATTNLLGGSWHQSNSPPHTPTSPKTMMSQTIEQEEMNPELARYLNRSIWEQKQKLVDPKEENGRPFSPTLPSAPFNMAKITSFKTEEYLQNGDVEEVDDFVSTLRSQLEIFVNRMKSNASRSRPIANDTAVQSLFMNITAMHAQLLIYIQEQDRKRVHGEQMQDKISQIRDARAALDALREEHREKVRREKEEQERVRQIQMMQKLEIMRKKKQEYLEYQRQLALHRMAESERQILSGGQSTGPSQGYPPINYPPQGYPTQGPPQIGGYMFPPQPSQGENAVPGIIPSYQGPPSQGHPPNPVSNQQPITVGYPGTTPTTGHQISPANPEYVHYGIQGPSPNMSVSSQNMSYGPPGPQISSPQGMAPSEHPSMVPPQTVQVPQQPQLTQPEEQAELISFD